MTRRPDAGAPTLGEFGRIARYFAPLAAAPGALGLKDDAALICVPPGCQLAATADAIVEGVHFRPADGPEAVARKLLRVNLSDLAAMGAVPKAYLLTMALPARCDDAWVSAFARGLERDQTRFGVSLVGGDSVSTSGPIVLSVTALGLVAAGCAIRRAGARVGDLVYVSGTIGDGALGLIADAEALRGIGGVARDWLRQRYLVPEPRVALGPALIGVAHAMLDVSDGLIADLGHLAAASGVAARIAAGRVPLSEAAADALRSSPALVERVLAGGDDYELLFAAPPERRDDLARIAARTGVAITEIGTIEAGQGVIVLDAAGAAMDLGAGGWRHV